LSILPLSTGYRVGLLLAATFIYAQFSSSTPEEIGWAEVTIAAILICLVGARGGLTLLAVQSGETHFVRFGRASLIFLIVVGSFRGLIGTNNAIGDFVRDAIPLLYMGLFIFLYPYLRRDPEVWLKAVSFALVFIGLSYSIRFFQIDTVEFRYVGRRSFFGDFNYFPMDPAVTFGAVFAMLEAFRALENRRDIQALLWLLVSVICIASLAAMLVRAPLILFATVLVVRTLVLKRPGLIGLTLKIGLLLGLTSLIPYASPLYNLVMSKFSDAGLNGKGAEMLDVLDFSFSGLGPLFFGTGWGGEFVSPSVNVPIRYVHNFSGYLLLKTGVFGFFIAICMIFLIYVRGAFLWANSRFGALTPKQLSNSVVGAALVTLSSSFFLQANFKSLSFGLVLVAVTIAQGHIKKLTLPKHS
jgi:hypothetical protein